MIDDQRIHTQVHVSVPVEKAWEIWTTPEHIVNWNFASPDWRCPRAFNDLRPGGSFNYRMEAKDNSTGFDFYGTYDDVAEFFAIDYTLGDGRKVSIQFRTEGEGTLILQDFQPETENSKELQQLGWQSIMNNYKAHVEQTT